MNLRTKLTAAATLTLLTATVLPAAAFPLLSKKKESKQQEVRKLTPSQSALVDKAIVKEKFVVESLKKRTPLVETYIQNMRPDPVMGAAPETDNHFLGRVDFGKVIGDTGYAKGEAGEKTGKLSFFKNSLGYITHLSASLHLTYHQAGFVQMLLVDSNSFNRQTYTFSYVRAEFLGSVPVVLFDVYPTKKGSTGRFSGRIFVDKNSGNIVRFVGSFSGGQENISEFFHFDSWRTSVQEGVWLPNSVYIEETDPKSAEHTLKFKAINYIWGYSLKVPTSDSTEADVTFGEDATASASQEDLSPLAEQRKWVEQAENNVIDRLYVAGLIDAQSDFDKTLTGMANNILIFNKINIDRPLKVRTLMTAPLESLAVGNTILLSKSLIDTTAIFDTTTGANDAQTGDLYALLAYQVAHVILGHHIDTKYAFNDRLLFPSESAFQKLPMHHTDADDAEAVKKAIALLDGDPHLSDGEKYFSLYLQQLQVRAKGLKALTEPQIGDSLVKADGSFWMQALISKGPKLNNADLTQQPAVPLDSFLKFDGWTDQVVTKNITAITPLLSPRDKYPFEITPVYLKLSEYKAPVAAPTPDAAPAAPATAPATPPAAAPAAADATTGTATPPADAAATATPAATPPQQ